MKFDSYTGLGVLAAVELVNRLTPGAGGGRPLPLPSDLEARRQLAGEVETRLTRRSAHLSPEAAEGLINLAAELREVFGAATVGDLDRAAGLVNQLLRRYQAAPQLARHDGEAWHLHFHSQGREAGRAVARGAMCATALAVVLGSPGAARLGVCQSRDCDRVFVDSSRNGRRRYCGAACLSRAKTAAFRARRAGQGSGTPSLRT
ncbi:MAG: CGNR zinc finger domain-containing protein [Candidatus Dormibacteria bacterium]